MDDGAKVVGGIQNTMKGLGIIDGDGGGGFVRVKAKPTEARYKKGWGSSFKRYQPQQKLAGKNYTEIKAECIANGILFEDPDFPAEDKSIFYSRTPPRPFEWKRPAVSFSAFFILVV